MRLPVSLAAVFMSFSIATAQTPGVPASSRDDGAVLEAFIDGVVTAHMRQHRAPGVTVSVVRDGRTLFAKGYGLADVGAKRFVAGDETMFRIGSVSKTFIWTAVTMLVERGQVDLDTDVNQYLQGVEIPGTFAEPVTLNDLMAHRGGFESTMAVFAHLDSSDLSVTDALNRDMPARIYAPGLRTSYSNWGSTLVSKIVADVSGKPYEQFLQEEILTPLSMTETTLKAPSLLSSVLLETMSIGYEMEAGAQVAAEPMQIGPHAPAGAIASTAADMARWMCFHLGGGQLDDVRLLSEDGHALMWTRAFTDRGSGADVAHGFMTKSYYGYATFAHGGATASFYTNMMLVPDLGLGVFVSQNATDDRALVADLPELIIQRLADAEHGPGKTEAGEALSGRAAECAGRYMTNRRSFTRFEKLLTSSATTVTAGEDGALVVVAGGTTTRYAPLAGSVNTYQDGFGNRIVFGRDEAGVVSHFSGPWGVHSHEKIGVLDSPGSLIASIAVVVTFTATTWMGLLWRRGVAASPTATGRVLGIATGSATVVLLVFAGASLWAGTSMAAMSNFSDYPSTAITVFRAIAVVVFLVGIAAAVSIWPAWRASGWRAGRKLHHTLFSLSLFALAVMMVRWNIVFAPTAV